MKSSNFVTLSLSSALLPLLGFRIPICHSQPAIDSALKPKTVMKRARWNDIQDALTMQICKH
jgi:hypothetical protein